MEYSLQRFGAFIFGLIISDVIFFFLLQKHGNGIPIHKMINLDRPSVLDRTLLSFVRVFCFYFYSVILHSLLSFPEPIHFEERGYFLCTLIIYCVIVINLRISFAWEDISLDLMISKFIKIKKEEIFQLFSFIILIPVAEEIFFRKFVFESLYDYIGVVLTILIQAVWFTVNHSDMDWQKRLLRGIIYCCSYYYTGYLMTPILCHCVHNFLTHLIKPSLPQQRIYRCNLCSNEILSQERYQCNSCPLSFCCKCHSIVGDYHKSNHLLLRKYEWFKLGSEFQPYGNESNVERWHYTRLPLMTVLDLKSRQVFTNHIFYFGFYYLKIFSNFIYFLWLYM